MNKFFRWVAMILIATQMVGDTPASTSIVLAFLGDVMLGRGVAQAHLADDWETVFAELAPSLQTADLAFANLESPLSVSPEPVPVEPGVKDYNLCAPVDGIQALQAAGLDVLTLANNHTRDCGEAGKEITARLLQEHDLVPVRGNLEPVWLQVDSLSLAIFALDDVSAPLDIEAAVNAVKHARQQNGLVVVSIHWGLEYHPGTESRQRMIAERLAQAGAALVVGHHPHVLQKVAWIAPEPGAASTLVAYSLGNAMFDQPMPDTTRSVALFASVNAYGVQTWWVVPFRIDSRQGRIIPADDDTIQVICSRLAGTPGCSIQNHFLKYPSESPLKLELSVDG